MNNKIELRKSERSQVKMRIGIAGPSGSGKTYSSLLLARGLSSDWNKIALIDTENKSGDLYSQLGAYNVITLEPPFSPERYLEAIRACEEGGMETIILDSATHEWDGKGGILEYVDSLGGKFQDWAKATPRHRKFIDAILQSSADIIVTLRKKQDYAMEQDQHGKTKVKKLGMKEIQREGFEYELTLNFDLETNHLAQASKDRTGLFMGQPEFVITDSTGKTIRDWNNSGLRPAPDYMVVKRRIMTEAKNLGWDPHGPNFKELVKRETGMELKDENLEAILKAMLDKVGPSVATVDNKVDNEKQQEKIKPPASGGDGQNPPAGGGIDEKSSREQQKVLLGLLEQKEGIDKSDEVSVQGWLAVAMKDFPIERSQLDQLTKREIGILIQELLKKKNLPPEKEDA